MNYARAMDEIFSQSDGPKFGVKLWDGKEYSYGKKEPNMFTIIIKDSATAKRLLAQGALGFGESYMEGNLQIDGDLEAYIKLRYQVKRKKYSLKLVLAAFMAAISTPHTRKNQIAYHYDLGNNFFEMLLDREMMSYSAGRYEKGSESLATAQTNKLDFVCRWLGLPAESAILDLGSGWGGFAKYAAVNFHWKVTGYTLSNAQLGYCKQLANRNHLERKISFEYRDMVTNLPKREFDGIVMIESIEHVGQKRLPSFLSGVKQLLKPGHPFIIQTTGRYVPRKFDRWTQKYVFPGGYLPVKDELLSAAIKAGFLVEEFRDDTPDYIRTMSMWIQNLESHRADIENEFGRPLYRLWELWMHGAKVAFEMGVMNLFRIHLRRPK